jgi:hypothetical protein
MDIRDRNPRTVELEQRYPRWSVWISETGYWWAALRRDLTAAECRAGCIPHVRADDGSELADLLSEQDALAMPGEDRP